MNKEIETLENFIAKPETPAVAILGGAKIADKAEILLNLVDKADQIIIGGALAHTFLMAQGLDLGDSLVDTSYVDTAKGKQREPLEVVKEIMTKAGDKLYLPKDAIISESKELDGVRIIDFSQEKVVPAGWEIFDIGPQTVGEFSKIIDQAKTIFWNGPMGLFEVENFAQGTKMIADKVAESKGQTIVGGGDTEAAIKQFNLEDKFTHVTTGGGAMLQFLSGQELPVIKYLIK